MKKIKLKQIFFKLFKIPRRVGEKYFKFLCFLTYGGRGESKIVKFSLTQLTNGLVSDTFRL